MRGVTETFDTADDAILHLVHNAQRGSNVTITDRNAIATLIVEYRRAERQLAEWVETHEPRLVARRKVSGQANTNGSRTFPMVEGKAPIGS